MKHLAVLLVLCGSAALGSAQFTEDRIPLKVRVGETVSAEVGFAMGHLCDDDAVARGEMRNKDADNNVFAVTGVAVGTTLCRAGTVTVENRPTYLFAITVVPAATKKPQPRR